MAQKRNMNFKSFFALLLSFIILFSIVAPTVQAAGAVSSSGKTVEEEVKEKEAEVKKYEQENGITGEKIDFSDTKKFNFDNDQTTYGDLASDHYKITKSGHNYEIVLSNLIAKKLILPMDDADKKGEGGWNPTVEGQYSGKPRKTNITITLQGTNKITGYGIEGTCIKGLKFEGSGSLEIKAHSEKVVETAKILNGATKEQIASGDIPLTVKLTSYIVPGIRIETGDDKGNSYSTYDDSNSLVFAGTGNITIDSPNYYGITNNGDVAFKNGHIKITSQKSAVSAHRVIVGDSEKKKTEGSFSLELNAGERAFYDKPTFVENDLLILASKFSGEKAAETTEVKSGKDIESSYTSYRYIKAYVASEKNAPEILNIEAGKVYCEMPRVTVKDDTAIESITVNNVPVTYFTASSSQVKTFYIPVSNNAEKVIVARDILGNEKQITVTAHGQHTLGTPVKSNVKEATCTEAGYYTDLYYCTVCEKFITMEKRTIPKKEHNFTDWKKQSGKEVRTCQECGYKEETATVIDISQASISLSATSYTYDGNEKKPAVTVKEDKKVLSNGKDYTVKYSNNINVGTATVTVTGKGDYEGTITANFKIKKRDNEITASNVTKTYSSKNQSFSIGAKQIGNAKLMYSSNNSYITVNEEGIVTIKAGYAGTAKITITSSETTSYYKATKTITVSTKKIDNSITASNVTKTYSTKEQSFLIGAKQVGDAKLSYSSDNKSVTVNSSGKVTIKKEFVGTANITITAGATDGYNKATKKITITVQKASNAITASNITKNFSKKAQSFLVGAKQTGNAKLSYSSNNKSITVNSSGKVTIKAGYAGTATITITAGATEKYNKATKKITVSTKRINNSITASNFTKTYSSKAQSFLVGAKQTGDAKLSYSSNNKSVTVSSSGKVTIKKGFIGKATITITASQTSGYNKATKKITITVNPSSVKISKIKNSSSKKMTVTWAKNTTVTGYKIEYSTDKNFKKDVKTVTVKKNSTISTTISKLTKGKTYYVRVRTYKTVSGTNYYSSWSAVKNIKISK